MTSEQSASQCIASVNSFYTEGVNTSWGIASRLGHYVNNGVTGTGLDCWKWKSINLLAGWNSYCVKPFRHNNMYNMAVNNGITSTGLDNNDVWKE